MKTTLLIMAAGIGARFGGGIKQLEPVGLHGEIIMDYSIHDAIEAGFNKIVFIIRHDIEADFREVIGDRIEKQCAACQVEVAYAFQELADVPEGVALPAGRIKPWGTGQAVLAAKNLIHTPFAVINADDYYGKHAFEVIHQYLCEYDARKPYRFCMAGFILKNTLSDHGGVTRGICKVDECGRLTDVVETSDIMKITDADGNIGASVHGESIDPNSYVSMNMWGLTPEFMETLETGFVEFFDRIGKGEADPIKTEYLLPIYIGQLLREGKVSVQLLETKDKWFGVTYKEDKAIVVDSIQKLVEAGVYKKDLFSDLSIVD